MPTALGGEQGIRLAVNLFDLDRVDGQKRRLLLAGKLDTVPVKVGSRESEVAVVFSCDLLAAATICDILRSDDRDAGDTPTRLYIHKKDWRRLGDHTVLATVVEGLSMLNPKVFGGPVPVVGPNKQRKVTL